MSQFLLTASYQVENGRRLTIVSNFLVVIPFTTLSSVSVDVFNNAKAFCRISVLLSFTKFFSLKRKTIIITI